MIEFKKLGAIPYQRTGEELTTAPAPAEPTYSDPDFFSTPILMQGLSPECGGFSVAFALAYLLKLQTPLSGSFTYAFEKTVDGVPDAQGTTINALGDAAQTAGSCLLNLFPDDGATTLPNGQPNNGTPTLYSVATQAAIQDAATRAGFLKLFLADLSWTGLQSAIARYGAVIVEAEVGAEWYEAVNGKASWAAADILPIRPPAKVIDSHFFTLGGEYSETQIFFANEWSEEWGQKGFGYLGPDYIPFIKNAVVFYKMPPSVQTVVNHPTLTPAQKNSLIQQIITDIEKEIGLITQQMGTL